MKNSKFFDNYINGNTIVNSQLNIVTYSTYPTVRTTIKSTMYTESYKLIHIKQYLC